MSTSLMPQGRQRYYNDDGTVAAGCKLYTYAAGTLVNKQTTSDAAGLVPNTNPIILDAKGECVVYWDGAYKIDLKTAAGAQITGWPVDNCVSSNSYADIAIASLLTSLLVGANTLVGWIQSGAGAVLRFIRDKLREHPSTADFGTVADNATNDALNTQRTADAKTLVEVVAGTYRMSSFGNKTGRRWIALGAVAINLFNSADVAMVKLKSGSYYEGFDFTSTETDLNSQRAAMDDETNVYVRLCGFFNFKNPTSSNAWGILIQRSIGAVLDFCRFGGNTQSDIAVTDAVRDLVVICPSNTVDGGVKLNVEPNAGDGLVGGNFIGGHYREQSWLENENSAYASRNNVVSGARIDLLTYDGSGVRFENCQIGSIKQEGTVHQIVFAGPLMIDTCDLQQNLITDPHMFDVSPSDATCFWTSYSSGTYPVKRYLDAEHGKYTRINDARTNQQVIITTRNFIPCTALESLMLFIRSRCDNTGTGTTIADHVIIQWYAGAALVLETSVKTNRCPHDAISDWCNDVAVMQAPATATQFKLRVTNNYIGNSITCVDVGSVGIFRYNLLPRIGGDGNMPNVLGELSKPNLNKIFYQNQIPAGANNYGGGLVGERIIRATPVVGQPKAWVCTAVAGVVGDPGTWVSEGVL